jgi:DNA-binding transcriptional LysR family regulator
MDFSLLRTLVAVADSGGFTKAEARIHRSQSTISQQIARLEHHVGRRLLERNTRTVTLTDYGEQYLAYARRILELEEEARTVLKAHQKIAFIRVGIPEDFAEFKLPALLRDFAIRQADMRLEIVSAPSFELRTRLDEGRLDLAIVKEEDLRKGGLCYWKEDLHWVAKANSNVQGERPVPLIVFPQGCPYRNRASAALEASGMSWRVTYESSNWPGIKAGVETGLGIALLADIRGLTGVQNLTEAHGFPPVESVHLVLRSKQTPPRGALALLAERLTRLVPQERPVSQA